MGKGFKGNKNWACGEAIYYIYSFGALDMSALAASTG
jgi:hypothetical protein